MTSSTPQVVSATPGPFDSRTIAQRYVLIQLLGQGAMGEVYEAEDTVRQRSVALKLVRLASGVVPNSFQFKQEFRAALGLRHPHLAEVFDFGFDGQRAFFTMELLPGAALEIGESWPIERACDVLAQLLLPLEFIHARGLLHRDLKPENVRFTGDGTLKILDLGLLEPIGARHIGHFGGTLAYLAPEALACKPLAATTDLYSVGAIAYELFTGKRPFEQTDAALLMHAHLRQVPIALENVAPHVPLPLCRLVMSLLEKSPKDRPQRAGDVLRSLEPWLGAARLEETKRQAYSYLLAPALVGREREVEKLSAALDAARAGAGRGVMIGAEAGVGKSRLVQEFRLRCQLDDVPCLNATCAYEGGGPYAVLRQILQALRPFINDEQIERYRASLAGLLPTAAGDAGATGEKSQLKSAFAALVAEAALVTPLVIWIDDLQWADTPSLDALAFSLDEHRSASVLWIGTYRVDEVGARHPVMQVLADRGSERLLLVPFTPGETVALVCSMLGSQTPPTGLMAMLGETTGGNGFFIVEMLRFMVDRGYLQDDHGTWRFAAPASNVGLPSSIEALVCKRLEGVSAAAQRLASAGAVLGDDLRSDVLAQLAGLTEQDLLDAINELIVNRVWQSEGDHYGFVHDRIREALYNGIEVADRRAMHQSFALGLEAMSSNAASLAYHFVRGVDLAKGLGYLRQAGFEAERQGAMQEAFRHWKQASDLLAEHADLGSQQLRLDLWLDLGIKCGFSVDSRVGEESLEKALAVLEQVGQPFLAARATGVALGLIKCLPAAWSRRIGSFLDRPRRFSLPSGWLRLLPPNYLALLPLLIGAYTYLVICYNTNGKISQALQANRKAQRLVPDKASWAWGVVMVPYAYSRVLEGRFEESVRIARECFQLLRHETGPEAIDLSCAALVLANNQVYQGHALDPELATELERRAAANQMTEWHGMVQYAPMVAHALAGRSLEAWEAIAIAQTFSKRCGRGTVLEREICLATARIHAVKGEFELGLEVIAYALRLDEVVPLPYFTSRLFEIRGRLHLDQKDLAAAARDFNEVLERERSYGLHFTLPEAYLGLCEVARCRGEFDDAFAHLSAAARIIDDPAFRCELKRVYLLRQRGRLAVSRGDRALARRCYASARKLAASQANPWQEALVLEDMGLLAREQGDEPLARELWDRAYGLFEETENAFGKARIRALLTYHAPKRVHDRSTPRDPDLQRLEILRAFAEAVAKPRTTADVLEAILVHAMNALEGDRGAILRPKADGFEVVVSCENGRLVWGTGPAFSHAVVRRAVATQEAQFVPDVREDMQLGALGSVLTQGLRALICFPLECEPESLVVYADRQTSLEDGFDHARVSVLRSLVQFGQLALSNARMIAQAHARSERLTMLNQTSLLVSCSLDINQVLRLLLDQVLKLTGAELALVLGTDDDRYEVLGARGHDSSMAYSRSVVAKVAATRLPLCVLDTDSSSLLPLTQSVVSLGVKSVMGVPLEVHDNLLGVLYVSSRLCARTFTDADLELLRAIASHAAMAIHNARQFLQVQEKRTMEHELGIAHTIQQGFFPKQVPAIAGLAVAGACQAAKEVGGDYYDVIPLPNGRVALTVGDVSGKSVSAALYMAVVRTALRMALEYEHEPSKCLCEVNARVHTDIKDGSFVTCFLGIFDPTTREFAYASAGHHLGYHISGTNVQPLASGGLPLGLDPDAFGSLLEARVVTLRPGDRIVLFTDGVIEALSPDNEEFGEEALQEALHACASTTPDETVARLLAAIRGHVADATPFDDLTLLVAHVDNGKPQPPPILAASGLQDRPERGTL